MRRFLINIFGGHYYDKRKKEGYFETGLIKIFFDDIKYKISVKVKITILKTRIYLINSLINKRK